MIIWFNETFGAGKSTTATELMSRLPGSRVFDTEEVGVMLRNVLSTETVRDFQDWRTGRRRSNADPTTRSIPLRRSSIHGG
ncbi:hypothetical protein [Nocardia sp. NPDC004722]